MDRLTKEKRSWNMSKIRHTNTKLELLVRKHLFSKGYRYRVKNNLLGKPDIVFAKKKIAIFINGCFWHQHKGCKLSYMPKSNLKFWKKKLESNVERDKKVNQELKKKGWKVLTVWECKIEKNINKIVSDIAERVG